MARSVRGRKKEVTLEINIKTGDIKVTRNYSGMDVIVYDPETHEATTLNPRELLVLERKKGGAIVVKETPPDTKITVVKVDPDAVKEEPNGTQGDAQPADSGN